MEYVAFLMDKNPDAWKLKRFWLGHSIRLSAADRAFFQDLARVRIIASADANQHHFVQTKTDASRRLNRFVELGLLKSHRVTQPGKGVFTAYSFDHPEFAKAWGGKPAVIGAKRNALHEVIVSKLFFAANRPDSFKVESDLKDDERLCYQLPGANKPMLPDAQYIDAAGELVAVEADSGHYTLSQVKQKQAAWSSIKQVWGQPMRANCKIVENSSISVIKL